MSVIDHHYLASRAKLYAEIRAYFLEQKVLEVDVPTMGAASVTDPHIDSLSVLVGNRECFLQTSPEFFLKRLLVENIGDVYYLGKAYRSDESGKKHNPEFTMLEWYRLGYDDRDLICDVVQLLKRVSLLFGADSVPAIHTLSYSQLFKKVLGVNPHLVDADELRDIALSKVGVNWSNESKSIWLDLLFTHCVEPNMPEGITVLYDFPACQCALARLGEGDQREEVAKRFEVYWNGIELANGYWEMGESDVLSARFKDDNATRRAMSKPEVMVDEKFLAAMTKGMPECSGVALGVDRLLMCLVGVSDINQVMPFGFGNL